MGDDQRYTRRTVIATGAAAAAALSGCTDEDEPDTGANGPDEPDDGTATGSPTATAPSLEEFEYPDGASVDGVDSGTLASTHRDAVTGAGSLTLDLSETREFDQFTDSKEYVKRWGAAGVSVTTEGDMTETLWSPDGERAGYVEMDTGFEQRYRIDNSAPSAERVTEVNRFQSLVAGAEWDEATEVFEDAAGGYAVRYEATNVGDEQALRDLFFGEVTDFEATIGVSEAGYVSEMSYDITVDQDHGTIHEVVDATVTAVGETTLQAPDWLETAQEKGTRFEMQRTEKDEVIRLEMVNGTEIPRDATVRASSGSKSGSAQLPEAISVGDQLNIAVAGEGDLRMAINETPAETYPLDRFVRATVRLDQYLLFEGEIQG